MRGEENVQNVETEVRDGPSEPATHTPPSSPPPAMKKHQNKKMGPPSVPASASRKRSVDETHGDPHSAAGSQAADADLAPLSQGKDETSIDSQSVKQSDSQTEVHAATAWKEAPAPSSTTPTQSQQLPRSGQGSQIPRPHSASGTKPAKPSATENEDREADASDSEGHDEPQDRVEGFNWDGLAGRYHDKMHECSVKEQQILHEFATLVNYFNTWAKAGNEKDTDRSFKRIKTQFTYVGHEEEELEKKRQHYVKVVEAFKTVATMLNDPTVFQGHAIIVQEKSVPKARPSSPPPKRRKKSEPRISVDDYGAQSLGQEDVADHGCWNFPAGRCVIL